jgi:hypothetical protein
MSISGKCNDCFHSATTMVEQYRLFHQYREMHNPEVTIRDWWNLRHTGLWQALAQYHRSYRHVPSVEFGTLLEWAALVAASNRRRRKLRNQWKGQTVVCVGNGPSIASTELELLDGQYVIGTNRAFLLLDRFKPKEFHLMVQDNQRVRELEPEISECAYPLHVGHYNFTLKWPVPTWMYRTENPPYAFLPRLKWYLATKDSNESRLCFESDFGLGFSRNPSRCMNFGYSVIFSAIQLAHYMGAKKIVCIGIDMNYTSGVNFVSGVTNIFPAFDYQLHGEPMFLLFLRLLNEQGVSLVNATPGGAVDCIERQTLKKALGHSGNYALKAARAA